RLLGGFLRPGVHVLQAAPGSFKTALSLQVAAECGFPALYVTAEMPTLALFERVVARVTKTFLGKLTNGELSPEEVGALATTTARQVPRMAFVDACAGEVTPAALQARAEALRDRFEARHVLLVIDSLHVWARSVMREATEYERITAAVDSVAALAKRLSCPVMIVAHKSRAGNKGQGSMHDSK